LNDRRAVRFDNPTMNRVFAWWSFDSGSVLGRFGASLLAHIEPDGFMVLACCRASRLHGLRRISPFLLLGKRPAKNEK